MVRRWTASILLLVALLGACTQVKPDNRPPEVICPDPPPVEVLTDDWYFVTDPGDVGLDQRWFALEADRNDWRIRPIGHAWEQDGLAYDGIGWYARYLEWDGSEAYLFLADADDSATVWIDGSEAASLDPDNPSTVLELSNPDGRALVVIRVIDEGGFGGIKSPPRLSPSSIAALDEARLINHLENEGPGLPAAPSGDAWTMIGGVDQATETLIGIEGGLSPWANAPSAQIWLHNSATGESVNPLAEGRFSLIDQAPIVAIESDPSGGVTVNSLAFFDEADSAIRWQIAADRQPGAEFDELIIAVRPFRVNRTMTAFCNPTLTSDRKLWVNNTPFLAAATAPDAFQQEETWAGLVYTLDPGATTLEFALPSAPDNEFPSTNINSQDRLTEAQTAWRERQARAAISVPDETVQSALEASLGYLLLASDPDGPHPGPLAHNAIWTRDAAYMGLALLMRGYDSIAMNYVNAIFGGQTIDGRIPPIQGEAIPWTNNEWDAQGQAIYLAMQVYRYTGDEAFLREMYPSMALAADYIGKLRRQTAGDPAATRGLLPISLSAEDLADGEQHYYWDNYWALVGLAQAADAADVLNTGDGARWRDESVALEGAIEASVAAVMGDPVPNIPASAETVDNSGMARGTTPALHPYPLVPPDDPLMTRAFQLYADRWITPYQGGYLHREAQFWTYGGIELANAYLRLDRGDLVHQILGWTLTHQTLPGAFAWAEQVDPNTFTFSGGDMPHAWMASSFTILIRNMLVLEYARGPEDDALTLFQTAPLWWFESDRQVRTRGLPTLYGDLDLSTAGTLRSEDSRWIGELTLSLDGATPPGGYRWNLPFVPASIQSDLETTLDGTLLTLPGPGTVTLIFE